MGYVEGTWICPVETVVKTGETTESVNLDQKIWLRQDRLVLQAIQATLTNNIAPLISSCQTSADAWSKLETTFANKSHTRMLTLLSTLMKVSKEGITVAEYMQNIKGDDNGSHLMLPNSSSPTKDANVSSSH
ncbi:unnamed protein product [Fraxinus pennsylvanica]|uniref:Gag protein n=1 Tax=Fraxinus pennsylvanica TaxID=56036 RepID=A0AAD2DKE0_9LAMI|nr:unnamed protein product [Fraxinus pennsylvanica]